MIDFYFLLNRFSFGHLFIACLIFNHLSFSIFFGHILLVETSTPLAVISSTRSASQVTNDVFHSHSTVAHDTDEFMVISTTSNPVAAIASDVTKKHPKDLSSATPKDLHSSTSPTLNNPALPPKGTFSFTFDYAFLSLAVLFFGKLMFECGKFI